ncbi:MULTISPECIES: hypothetical protein [unclassified Sphingomonas]|uniref:hypothetical protein n=1 Tax=unclassified Sphingomonas TaxID=196159 RepID=UPI0006F48E8D|nr:MULTISPECIES: hypothetical protein [unclassified Sphingomonas]KQX19373.1 hypothetical protein ASD17_12590 [Sphingomonas sp. Root1294]KQY65576.1 hypothetical protein ASD39_15790 [Sphingomonas sp. Root50]KRB95123.1 hypothetical protein ASE22_04265 [Sphingomonas sp. Root720]
MSVGPDVPSSSDLYLRARATEMVEIEQIDREEFGRALILQGYSAIRAAEMARELPDNDGALQMLARHRRTALPSDVVRLVIAARIYLFEDESQEARRELDQASGAFASRVPWDNDPTQEAAA